MNYLQSEPEGLSHRLKAEEEEERVLASIWSSAEGSAYMSGYA